MNANIILKISTLLFVYIACNSCSNNPLEPKKYSITFENQTDYALTISDLLEDTEYKDFDTFSIESGEIKKIESKDDCIALYSLVISHNPSIEKRIEAELIGCTRSEYYPYDCICSDHIRFYQFAYEVQYKISGTAEKVDVTLNNASGGTEQFDNVQVPHSYQYKYFSDDFVYISAQNQGESGSVTVQIFHKGELFKSATSSGAYVIATASGGI